MSRPVDDTVPHSVGAGVNGWGGSMPLLRGESPRRPAATAAAAKGAGCRQINISEIAALAEAAQ